MNIFDLPAELLSVIVDFLLPDDFESLILSCQAAYRILSPKLPEHNELNKRYRYVEITTGNIDNVGESSSSPAKAIHVLHVLNELKNKPRLNSYLRHLALNIQDVPTDDAHDEFSGYEESRQWCEKVRLFADVTEERTRNFCARCTPQLEKLPADPCDYLEQVQQGEHFTAVLVLLAIGLPGVRTIRLARHYWTSRGYQLRDSRALSRLQTLVVGSLEAGLASAVPSLEVLLPLIHEGYDPSDALSKYPPFLVIPSLRVWYGDSLSVGAYGDTFRWPEDTWQDSNIESIILCRCSLVKKSVKELLPHFSRLRVLLWHHTIRWHGAGYEWDPTLIVDTLIQSPCRPVLERLSLDYDDWEDEGAAARPPSFRAFTNLRHLELHMRCWYFRRPPTRRDIDAKISPIPLADVLPFSLQTLRLLTTDHLTASHINDWYLHNAAASVQELLNGMLSPTEASTSKLNNLRHISIALGGLYSTYAAVRFHNPRAEMDGITDATTKAMHYSPATVTCLASLLDLVAEVNRLCYRTPQLELEIDHKVGFAQHLLDFKKRCYGDGRAPHLWRKNWSVGSGS